MIADAGPTCKPERFVRLLRHGDLVNRLTFATEHPHWDFEAPTEALPKTRLPREFQQRLYLKNALDFYGPRLLPRASS